MQDTEESIDAVRRTCYSKNKYGGKYTAGKKDDCPEETHEALLVVDYNLKNPVRKKCRIAERIYFCCIYKQAAGQNMDGSGRRRKL